MGSQVLSLGLKLLLRSRGLKVALIVAATYAVLLALTRETVPYYLLMAVSVPSSISIILTDLRSHASSIYALHVVGATPKDIKSLAAAISAVVGLIISAPYAILGLQHFLLASAITTASAFSTLTLIQRSVKSRLTAVTQ